MTILIDGYNLLYTLGLRRGESLEQGRKRMLNLLADHLADQVNVKVTVVFDAAHPPPGVPRRYHHRGLDVRFAAGYAEADDLLEELIRGCHTPKQLLMVSSDHRLHRAARARNAAAMDSEEWYDRLLDESEWKEDELDDDLRDGDSGAVADSGLWIKTFEGRDGQDFAKEEERPPTAAGQPSAPSRVEDQIFSDEYLAEVSRRAEEF